MKRAILYLAVLVAACILFCKKGMPGMKGRKEHLLVLAGWAVLVLLFRGSLFLEGTEFSSPYGLYVKYVNGIKADFNVDSAYWAFYVNGEYALTGASFIEIKDGDSIKIAYEKF